MGYFRTTDLFILDASQQETRGLRLTGAFTEAELLAQLQRF